MNKWKIKKKAEDNKNLSQSKLLELTNKAESQLNEIQEIFQQIMNICKELKLSAPYTAARGMKERIETIKSLSSNGNIRELNFMLNHIEDYKNDSSLWFD